MSRPSTSSRSSEEKSASASKHWPGGGWRRARGPCAGAAGRPRGGRRRDPVPIRPADGGEQHRVGGLCLRHRASVTPRRGRRRRAPTSPPRPRRGGRCCGTRRRPSGPRPSPRGRCRRRQDQEGRVGHGVSRGGWPPRGIASAGRGQADVRPAPSGGVLGQDVEAGCAQGSARSTQTRRCGGGGGGGCGEGVAGGGEKTPLAVTVRSREGRDVVGEEGPGPPSSRQSAVSSAGGPGVPLVGRPGGAGAGRARVLQAGVGEEGGDAVGQAGAVEGVGVRLPRTMGGRSGAGAVRPASRGRRCRRGSRTRSDLVVVAPAVHSLRRRRRGAGWGWRRGGQAAAVGEGHRHVPVRAR